jgi:hypothetical protein
VSNLQFPNKHCLFVQVFEFIDFVRVSSEEELELADPIVFLVLSSREGSGYLPGLLGLAFALRACHLRIAEVVDNAFGVIVKIFDEVAIVFVVVV